MAVKRKKKASVPAAVAAAPVTPTEAVDSAALLRLDAHNRAWRTTIQGLALDVLIAVALVVYDLTGSTEPDYRLLPALVAKTALHSAASYVMRAKLDPSRVPTPLPPSPVAAPADEVIEGP